MKQENRWNWQGKGWPSFHYEASAVSFLEQKFKDQSLISYGVFKHLSPQNKEELKVRLVCDEAYKTSEIEGDFLDRDSLQSSVQRYFGFHSEGRTVAPENGISEMIAHGYKTFSEDLCEETLFHWHKCLMNGRRDIENIGCYRTHTTPMQIVSGAIYAPKVHFEAPPATRVPSEMKAFIDWFNRTQDCLSPLLRASLAHLYFESIHPFEDGNGRIGRALVEKSLSQYLGYGALISLSTVIQGNKKEYYHQLHLHSQSLEVTDWVVYFSEAIVNAQNHSMKQMEFLIHKTVFLSTHSAHLNLRQTKVIQRIFQEGIKGFEGGLSAQKYISITATSASTATRDLEELVLMGALKKTGERRGTRYWLNLN